MRNLAKKMNLAEKVDESWSPPLLTNPDTRWRRFAAAIRVGSISKRDRSGVTSGRNWRQSGEGFLMWVAAPSHFAVCCRLRRISGHRYGQCQAAFRLRISRHPLLFRTSWPVADLSVDVVLITETLEHVFEVGPFLDEAYRCLRPGTRFIASVPFAARCHFVPHDFWRFTPSCLKRLLETARFEEIAVYARGNRLTVACYKVMALITPLLLPQGGGLARRQVKRLIGLLSSPVFVLCAILGNISLRGPGGDDCLGYTILARKPNLPQ